MRHTTFLPTSPNRNIRRGDPLASRKVARRGEGVPFPVPLKANEGALPSHPHASSFGKCGRCGRLGRDCRRRGSVFVGRACSLCVRDRPPPCLPPECVLAQQVSLENSRLTPGQPPAGATPTCSLRGAVAGSLRLPHADRASSRQPRGHPFTKDSQWQANQAYMRGSPHLEPATNTPPPPRASKQPRDAFCALARGVTQLRTNSGAQSCAEVPGAGGGGVGTELWGAG